MTFPFPTFGLGSLVVSSPTTWNPSDKGTGVTLSGGDLLYSNNAAGTNALVRSVFSASSGKHYWEITITAAPGASSAYTGIAKSTHTLATANLGVTADGWAYLSGGDKNTNSVQSAYGTSYTNGDVIMHALDMDSGKKWFGKNGTWQASGDPAAGTNEAFSGISGTIFAAYCANANWTSTANFGASAFSYTPPAGFRLGFGA